MLRSRGPTWRRRTKGHMPANYFFHFSSALNGEGNGVGEGCGETRVVDLGDAIVLAIPGARACLAGLDLVFEAPRLASEGALGHLQTSARNARLYVDAFAGPIDDPILIAV